MEASETEQMSFSSHDRDPWKTMSLVYGADVPMTEVKCITEIGQALLSVVNLSKENIGEE